VKNEGLPVKKFVSPDHRSYTFKCHGDYVWVEVFRIDGIDGDGYLRDVLSGLGTRQDEFLRIPVQQWDEKVTAEGIVR
jgi:hypothetical protein